MYYLISQILVSLLFTAALGVIVGWILRGISARVELAAVARELQRERLQTHALEARSNAAATAPAAPPAPAEATSAPRTPARDPHQEPGANEALAALRERLSQLDGVARGQAERIAELGHRLREKDDLLNTLKPAVTTETARRATQTRGATSSPTELLVERPAQADRLQAISGIGPVLERVLNELGIYRFRQLARLTPGNIEWLAARIDWFPQRIQREDWVGQARRLHREIHPDEDL